MPFELSSERLLPRWVVVFFLGGAVVLIPWIVLMFTVPQAVNVTRRWELVWGGFDCFLVLGFAVTAFRLITRSPRGAVTAAMTGTMLLIDAWFDVLTTHRGGQIISILMAIFAEIPCALICFYVSRRIVGLFEQAKDYLAEAGFSVHGGLLVPPQGFLISDPIPTHTAAPAHAPAPAEPVAPSSPRTMPATLAASPMAPAGIQTAPATTLTAPAAQSVSAIQAAPAAQTASAIQTAPAAQTASAIQAAPAAQAMSATFTGSATQAASPAQSVSAIRTMPAAHEAATARPEPTASRASQSISHGAAAPTNAASAATAASPALSVVPAHMSTTPASLAVGASAALGTPSDYDTSAVGDSDLAA